MVLASYAEGFAHNFGAKVRDVVNEYGPGLGVCLREDTQAKGEWVIDGYGGGMLCKGRGGAINGRPADLLILDDLIKNHEEAQSETILNGIWDWYSTIGYGRLGPTAPIVGIGTRWGPKDIFARWREEEKAGGEKYEFIVLKAIAEENDVLGRKPGEALWPERQPLWRLQRIQKATPRWFRACWQGDPEETLGLHFQPGLWGTYTDAGDAWRVFTGVQWNHYRKVDCTIILALDWAQKGKKSSDHTAFVVAALTPDGLLLILDVFNQRLRYEQNRPALEKYCRLWHPQIVAGDDDMLSEAMLVECRRSAVVPEVRRLAIAGKGKLIRAQAAIIRSQNGRVLKPDPPRHWYNEMEHQLTAFTGADGAQDDIADCFGILGRLADEFKVGEETLEAEPMLVLPGFDGGFY